MALIKVTVIAIGFNRAAEEHAHLMKQASRQPVEREAQAPATRASQSHHGAEPAFVRRPAPSSGVHQTHSSAPPAMMAQAQLPHSQAPHVREPGVFVQTT